MLIILRSSNFVNSVIPERLQNKCLVMSIDIVNNSLAQTETLHLIKKKKRFTPNAGIYMGKYWPASINKSQRPCAS